MPTNKEDNMTTTTDTVALETMLSNLVAKCKIGDQNVQKIAESIKHSVDPFAEGAFNGYLNPTGELQSRGVQLDVAIASRHAYYEALKLAIQFAIKTYGEDVAREVFTFVGGKDLLWREARDFAETN